MLNKWDQGTAIHRKHKTPRTVATIGAAYTAFHDTIDGNKDYKVDVKTEILANGQAIEATVTVDLRVLASYFLGDSQADDVLTAAQAALLRSALSNVKLELLCNADSGDLYLKCSCRGEDSGDRRNDNADLGRCRTARGCTSTGRTAHSALCSAKIEDSEEQYFTRWAKASLLRTNHDRMSLAGRIFILT